MAQFMDRMIRASKLEVRLYEEVETDPAAMRQALGIVLLSSLAAGIGDFVHGGVAGLVIGTVTGLLGWYAWAYITYVIGAKLFPMPETSTSHRELLRTLGFASAPGLLRALGLRRTPVLRWGPRGMQQLSETRAGRFELLGFAGNSAPDHIDHLHALPELLAQAFTPH